MRLMKDKLKGLVVGLALGTMMTGSLTYAATSTDIGVYFRELKFVFDGMEKAPPEGQQGFIYNDTTYVPLRFVSESLGKDVNFDNDTGTIWIGKNYGGEAAAAVATYQGGQVSKVELDTFISATAFYNPQAGGSSANPAYRQSMLQQLIAFKLLAARASDTTQASATTAADLEYAGIVQYFGSEAGLETNLKPLQLTLSEIKQYISQRNLVTQVLLTMVDDASVQAEYDRQKKADSAAFVTATVRHILIGLTDPNTGTALRTDAEALARAKEVKDKLAKGGDFAELAKTYSDDAGSKNNGGRYTDADISGFVEAFKKASAEQPLHQVGDPVKTEYGYHLVEVESRKTKSLDEVKDQLKSQLIGPVFQKFLTQEVPGLILSNSLAGPQK
ncbi:peptidylprolyl isomerase [Paenibacillus sp. HJGM_3]|uniref:peptidylprolyl isomerase n=1 Tax=Paenibacillus sp. HJGM_3 TaxID=3379816 RepID=UPI00385A0700